MYEWTQLSACRRLDRLPNVKVKSWQSLQWPPDSTTRPDQQPLFSCRPSFVPCSSTTTGFYLQNTAEQCLTRVQCTSRPALSQFWPWRRFVLFKRCVKYRLRTCIGCWWMLLFMGVWPPGRRPSITPKMASRPTTGSRTVVPKCAPASRTEPSCSRPNSGGGRPRRFGFYIFLLLLLGSVKSATGVRVAVDSTSAAGVPDSSATFMRTTGTKRSGDTFSHGPQHTVAQKRSFRRAIRRAEQHGHTQYKGRRYTIQQLLGLKRGTAAPVTSSTRRPPGRRLVSTCKYSVLSWNVGGLTNSLLDELQTWLSQPAHSHIWVVALQETRWTFSSEWSNRHWTFVHSGSTSQRGGGVLVMISSKLCQPTNVRSRELSEGRLLHVRIPLAGQDTALDILNVYQYVWNMFADTSALRHKRRRLLQQLEAAARECPQRNLCLCVGDFNVQLSHHAGLVGTSTTLQEHQPQTAQDSDLLTDLLHAQQLLALNTWTGRRRQAYTYYNQQTKTQIDYILARRSQATSQMRQCRPLRDFPVAAWRTCGMHRPLQVNIDYTWRPPPSKARACAPVDIERIRDDMYQDTSYYRGYQQALVKYLAAIDTIDMDVITIDMDVINERILTISHRYYPQGNKHQPLYHA